MPQLHKVLAGRSCPAVGAFVVAGKDVRIGGGPTVVRDFLKAGLIDQLHVAITPILLDRGIRLWDDLREIETNHDVRSEVAESGIIHVTFQGRSRT